MHPPPARSPGWDVSLAGSHQPLGSSNERVRDGIHLFNSPMALECLHDERLKCFVGGAGRCSCEAVRGVYELHAVWALAYHGKRPTELGLEEACQGGAQGWALVQRCGSLD